MKEEATSSEDLIDDGKIHDVECQCEKMEGDFVKLIDRMTETYDQLNKKNETGGTINTTKTSQENNSTFIQNEIQQSKLKGEIDILNNRLKTERLISEALQSDIENLETRYKNRNVIIDDYENKMKSQFLR